MKSPKYCFIIAVIFAALISTLSVMIPRASSQTSRPALTGEELSKELHTQAQSMKMTDEQYKEFLRKLGGASGPSTSLMYDPQGKVSVTYESNPDGSAKKIDITGDATGPNKAYIKYEVANGKAAGIVTYSSNLPSGPEDRRHAIWQDLNADGIFDLLLITVDHNELLNLDRGVYILFDGKWTHAEHNENMPANAFNVGTVMYHFDSNSGRWVH